MPQKKTVQHLRLRLANPPRPLTYRKRKTIVSDPQKIMAFAESYFCPHRHSAQAGFAERNEQGGRLKASALFYLRGPNIMETMCKVTAAAMDSYG